MRIFIAGLATESSSFSPIPTGRANFEESFVAHGDATRRAPMLFSAPLHVWRAAAEGRGWEVVESLSAFAQPAGPTVKSLYEEYRDEILHDLEAAMPVDIVLFSMHGAMMADGYPDCEGDLLRRTRAIVGSGPTIGAEFDPHAHLTDEMLDTADLLVFYKEYPHTDVAERAADLFRLAVDTAEGRIQPVMREVDCRMIGLYQTPLQPMRDFVDRMSAAERDDERVLSVSLVHGFPWGDHERTGTRVLAITDGDAVLAEKLAAQFATELWDLREQLQIDYPDIDAALDMAVAEPKGPVVLADVSDNAGGGAPSDTTWFLQAVLKRGLKNVALGIFWDPIALRLCVEAGEGARLRIRVGGKVGSDSGQPVDLDVVVHRIAAGKTQDIGGATMSLGTIAWVEADGVHLLINDLRTQVFHPEAFTSLGLDLSSMRIIIVKSTQHFYAGFEPIASRIIHTATPGPMSVDFANIPYRNRDGNYWPRVEDPFAAH
jgi:microcystin degradation protein MlrC